MKNISKQKLISSLIKILKLKTKNQLLKIKKKNCDNWDSLVHLNIIFLLEKNIKKKISINRLNKVSSGKDLIRIIDED